MKYETHENIDDKIYDDDMYKIDKMSLGENKWRKRSFENELKITYNIKIPNGMNCIHDNEVNKISELNLLHDILNPSKCT